MSCLCRFLSTVPAPGDGEVVILSKILQVLNDGGGSGLGGVTSISVDGGPAQTGAVSITTGGASALFNFTDENTANDGVMWANQRTTEVLRSVGATGFLQTTAGRIHRDVDNSVLAFLGGTAKSTSSFFEMAGQAAASPGFAVVTTKGQTLGAGTFRIINAPNSSTVGTVRAEMVWEGNWALTPIWNDVASAFVAFDVNPTNTLSAAGALLGRFRTSGVSQWEVSKTGNTTQLGSATINRGTLTAFSPSIDVTSTWNNAGVTFTSLRFNVTDTASAALSLLSDYQVGGVSRWSLNKSGTTIQAGSVTATQLFLPNTTSATSGGIYFGGIRAVHNFGTENFFAGGASGNLTMTGTFNSALGGNALQSNTTGDFNSALGANALRFNTTGASNSALGVGALQSNTTGTSNSALGVNALRTNTTGISNSALGVAALQFNTTGISNSALGVAALQANITGASNSALGSNALLTNTAGDSNTAVGYAALLVATGSNNIAIGYQAGNNLTTGLNNIILGFDIDSPTATNSNTLTIGNLIFGTGLTSTGTTVSTGRIGVAVINPVSTFQVVGTSTFGNITQTTAALFSVASGANQRAGNATLVGGTVTVANTTVTANSIVMLTRKTSGGTIGTAITYTVSAGASFTINSDNILDTSTFSYFVMEVP